MNPPQENFLPPAPPSKKAKKKLSKQQIYNKSKQQIYNKSKQQIYNNFSSKFNKPALALKLVTPELASYVNKEDGETALITACDYGMSEIALALIATGQSKPEHFDNRGDTALILACENEMIEVALALIATGQSNPGKANKKGQTALIWACENNMTEVALALIATGQSNPEQSNNNGQTALDIAIEKNMTEVVDKLNKPYNYIKNITNTSYTRGGKKKRRTTRKIKQ